MTYPVEHYASAISDLCDAHMAYKPPARVSVSEGASQNLVIRRPGDAPRLWSARETPYMIEPMDMLASRRHEGIVFVGPAQSGKTMGLGEGWITHAVINDPGDMLVVQMTEGKAREYSKQRIDRLLKAPKLAALMSASARDDNTHDKKFKHGMWLKIAWPTTTNFASTSYRYVFITDFDRMDDSIEGEGSAFELGLKRTTTFLSRGMCAVESSPGRPLMDPLWVPGTAHAAPPVSGILGLYNNTDRRRWYWKCPDCRDWFEAAPGVGLFHLPPDEQLMEEVLTADVGAMAARYARVVCPHCGSMLDFRHRSELNQRGRWLLDGQRLTSDDELVGEPLESRASRAGFWLGGVAAEYQTWHGLLNKHLLGLKDYALTGSEESLQTSINTDQAMPYTPRHLVESVRGRVSPVDLAEQGQPRFVVPEWTRVLLAAVDVQGGTNARFVVEVHAYGKHAEKQLVDRFEIKYSKREGMGEQFAPLDPASHPEDWDLITEKVLYATWRTPTVDREMRVRRVTVDSGGEDGVTENAYRWWRRVRKLGLASRARLFKGEGKKGSPIIRESLVGKNEHTAKADVLLLICNTNLLSDIVDNMLKRQKPGPGFVHLPKPRHPTLNPDGWLSPAYFEELAAEVRQEDGTWMQLKKRNEAFDLHRMIHAAWLSLGCDKLTTEWDDDARLPEWLQPLAKNSEIVAAVDRREMKEDAILPVGMDYAAKKAAGARRFTRRRTIASPYLSG